MENDDMGQFDQTKVYQLLQGPGKTIFLQKYKLCQRLMASFWSLSISSIIFKVMIDINQHTLKKRDMFLLEQNLKETK